MERNTPNLWDKLWDKKTSIKEDIYRFNKIKNSIRWQRIENKVINNFKSFNNLKVIEIGSGTGSISAIMAEKGAKVTLLDYSQNALIRAREYYERNNLSAKYIRQNALLLSKDLYNKYDVSMSFGLAEHFHGKDRINIIKSHFNVLKTGGITFISVPNKLCLPYRIYRFLAKLAKKWTVGEDYLFSRKEFIKICNNMGIFDYSFFGDSIFHSFSFINPILVLNEICGKKFEIKHISQRKEKGTALDEYFSYALVLYAKKKLSKNV